MDRTPLFADAPGIKTLSDHPCRVCAIAYLGQLLFGVQNSVGFGRTGYQPPCGRGCKRVLPAFGERHLALERRDLELPQAVIKLASELVPSGAPRPARIEASLIRAGPEAEATARSEARREKVMPRQFYIRRNVGLAR